MWPFGETSFFQKIIELSKVAQFVKKNVQSGPDVIKLFMAVTYEFS
jgi:hypothetical protein